MAMDQQVSIPAEVSEAVKIVVGDNLVDKVQSSGNPRIGRHANGPVFVYIPIHGSQGNSPSHVLDMASTFHHSSNWSIKEIANYMADRDIKRQIRWPEEDYQKTK